MWRVVSFFQCIYFSHRESTEQKDAKISKLLNWWWRRRQRWFHFNSRRVFLRYCLALNLVRNSQTEKKRTLVSREVVVQNYHFHYTHSYCWSDDTYTHSLSLYPTLAKSFWVFWVCVWCLFHFWWLMNEFAFISCICFVYDHAILYRASATILRFLHTQSQSHI